MTKATTPAEMSKGKRDNTNNATKIRLHRGYGPTKDGQWSNYGHPTDVVNRFTGPTSPLPQQSCNQKDTHLKICK